MAQLLLSLRCCRLLPLLAAVLALSLTPSHGRVVAVASSPPIPRLSAAPPTLSVQSGPESGCASFFDYSTGNGSYVYDCVLGADVTFSGRGTTPDTTILITGTEVYPCPLMSWTNSCSSTGDDTQQLRCTFPTSVSPSDLHRPLNITATSNGLTSRPYTAVSLIGPASLSSIGGCHGGSDGAPATDCYPRARITLFGSELYGSGFISIGNRYNLNVDGNRDPNSISFNLPTFDAADFDTVLPITLTLNGQIVSYAPGLSSSGPLTLSSIAGCSGTTSKGYPTGCLAGQTVTFIGTGFTGAYGGAPLTVWIRYQPCTDLQVQSNTRLTCVLPVPTEFSTFTLITAGSSGIWDYPLATAQGSLDYAVVPLVTGTASANAGGCQDEQPPVCQPGGVLRVELLQGAYALPDSVVLGSAYACGSIHLNVTGAQKYNYTASAWVQCTVPQVSSVDLGQLLSVAVTIGGVTSALYGSGLVVLASLPQME